MCVLIFGAEANLINALCMHYISLISICINTNFLPFFLESYFFLGSKVCFISFFLLEPYFFLAEGVFYFFFLNLTFCLVESVFSLISKNLSSINFHLRLPFSSIRMDDFRFGFIYFSKHRLLHIRN